MVRKHNIVDFYVSSFPRSLLSFKSISLNYSQKEYKRIQIVLKLITAIIEISRIFTYFLVLRSRRLREANIHVQFERCEEIHERRYAYQVITTFYSFIVLLYKPIIKNMN